MKNKMLVIEKKNKSYSIPKSDVLFIKTSHEDHKIEIITKSESIAFYGSLNDIEKNDPIFFRCHKSYLVNLENVREIDKINKVIRFDSMLECPLSRRSIKLLIERLRSVNNK